MGRALVIVALVIALPSVARGDTTTLPVSRVNVVLPTGWEVTGVMRGAGDRVTGPSGEVVVLYADECDLAWSVLDENEQRAGDPELGDLPDGWIGRVWPASKAFCHARSHGAVVVWSTRAREGVDPLLEALGDGWFSNRFGVRYQLVVLPGTELAVQLPPHLTLYSSDPAERRDVLEVGPDWEYEPDGSGREQVTIHRFDERCDELLGGAEPRGNVVDAWPSYAVEDGRIYYCQELVGTTVVVDAPDDAAMEAAFGDGRSNNAILFGVRSLLTSLRDERVEPVPGEQVTLPGTGYRVTLLAGWRAEVDGDADRLVGPTEGAELRLSVHDSTCAEHIAEYESRTRPNAYDDAPWIPAGWHGAPLDAYCIELGGRFLTVQPDELTRRERLAYLASLIHDNTAVEEVGGEVVLPGEPPPDTDRSPSRGRSVLGSIKPRTVLLALVRRADDQGSGFGFGLKVGRLGWREDHRFTIGYEVGAAAASGFWELSAQVRPGVSPKFKDLPADAYVVLGVDVTGGKHQEETDVAPVAGVGADVLFTLPGIGADLAGQVLADPDGLHSYTLHGGVLFGDDDSRVRLGATYVKFADDTNVLWMTLGFTRLELN